MIWDVIRDDLGQSYSSKELEKLYILLQPPWVEESKVNFNAIISAIVNGKVDLSKYPTAKGTRCWFCSRANLGDEMCYCQHFDCFHCGTPIKEYISFSPLAEAHMKVVMDTVVNHQDLEARKKKHLLKEFMRENVAAC
ncbi:hypothetical protein O6P43_013486 [Quillaja saponaria]|uniref:Uncharacterized protein n=1 Tax=Quillaja saponaria TaxID=32244 RepID=A0AAD7LSJ8_QUISA|nr:hypothetical protein O6P43_013486 [Quillaja saponaria]